MISPLATLGKAWDEFADGVTDWQVDLLRRTAVELSHDTAARRAVEGARDWRNLQTGNRYADR